MEQSSAGETTISGDGELAGGEGEAGEHPGARAHPRRCSARLETRSGALATCEGSTMAMVGGCSGDRRQERFQRGEARLVVQWGCKDMAMLRARAAGQRRLDDDEFRRLVKVAGGELKVEKSELAGGSGFNSEGKMGEGAGVI